FCLIVLSCNFLHTHNSVSVLLQSNIFYSHKYHYLDNRLSHSRYNQLSLCISNTQGHIWQFLILVSCDPSNFQFVFLIIAYRATKGKHVITQESPRRSGAFSFYSAAMKPCSFRLSMRAGFSGPVKVPSLSML